jgi:hypothetical protein
MKLTRSHRISFSEDQLCEALLDYVKKHRLSPEWATWLSVDMSVDLDCNPPSCSYFVTATGGEGASEA